MQGQDDPFQIGGSINPAKLSGGVIIANLAAGYSCMSFLSASHWDWSLVKGRIGCRPGAFMVYFGCRYLAAMSVVSTIVYLDAFAVTSLYPLRYLAQVTGGIALGLAYSVLLIRIATIFQNNWLSVVLDVLRLVFWAIIWKTTTEVPGAHQRLGTEFAMAVYTLVVSTLAFLTVLVHSMHACKTRRARYLTILDRMRTLWEEDVCEYALVCASAIASAVVTFLDHDPSGFSNFATSYMKFIISTLVACRLYRKMVQRLDKCPSEYCITLRCARTAGRWIGQWLRRDRLSQPGPAEELRTPNKTCSSRYFTWLRILGHLRMRRPPPAQAASEHDPEAVPNGCLPMSVMHSTNSRAASGRKGPPRACLANSRSTYANTSLFDSQAS